MPIDPRGEFTSGELIGFVTCPVAVLADRYYLLIDVDPGRRLRKTQQLFEVIHRRKLTLPELGEAWMAAKEQITGRPATDARPIARPVDRAKSTR